MKKQDKIRVENSGKYFENRDETQELFEKLALVIIDFKKSIENGFINMTNEINLEMENDYQ